MHLLVELTKQEVKLFLNKSFETEKINSNTINDLECKIKGVGLKKSKLRYKKTGEKTEQFKEFFVQKVFTSKSLSENIKFINKGVPFFKNNLQLFESRDLYWINTPLKTLVKKK